ncbi:GPI inositol deacylase [Malassezia cuniculi]|uniref:GPI inositol-deacylase n=1 Tax=Malassezia cuniculi TaxID=948313 RepID=A0AAF0J5G4_9BASI|nr:GPI inositol deacylase [Malassezia cuniculi]
MSDAPPLRRYNLYQYREHSFPILSGVFGQNKSTAVPVLFIPGNAGSYGQIRSIASSTARQYYSMDSPRPEFSQARGPVEWWTIDFGEDFSAFSGRVLEDQAWYVNEAIRYLRSIYNVPGDEQYVTGERNMTVGLLGHSMGGVSARLALHMPNYIPGSVDTIVTLATPHAYPPVNVDRSLEKVYTTMNQPIPGKQLVISLGGGLLDNQVPSDASSLSLGRLHDPDGRLSSYTTTVAGLWSSLDHVSVVWCDQLRARIARAFLLDLLYFDMVAEPRADPELFQQRRSLWRSVLGLPLEAASPRERSVALLGSQSGPIELHDLSPPQKAYLWGELGLYNLTESSIVTHLLSPPGPNHRYDIDQTIADDNERLAFELVTNLGIGPTRISASLVHQDFEVFVLACVNAQIEGGKRENAFAQCSIVHPRAFSILPYSPRREDLFSKGDSFPNASFIYDAPTKSLSRLRFSADFLRNNHIEFFRIESRAKVSEAAHGHGNVTIMHAGWVPDKPYVLVGAPNWWSEHTFNLTQPESLADSTRHAPVWEWLAVDIDSSLLAYNLVLKPAKCLGTRDAARIDFMPILRTTNLATGDSRFYPSLPFGYVHLPMMLHGSAPFMPPANEVQKGTLFQLWVPPAFDKECPVPYEEITLTVNRRASVGLLLMRYRMALLSWPTAVLALAYIMSPTDGPTAALVSLAQPLGLAFLVGVPAAIHALASTAHSLSLGVRWYTVGVGLVSFRSILIGPGLALMSYALAMLASLVVDGLVLVLSRLVRPLGGEMHYTRRLAITGGCVLAFFCALLPYQLLVAACITGYAYVVLRSKAACRNQPQGAPSRVAHRVRAWNLIIFFWLLPLLLPTIAAWGRHGAGFWGVSLLGIIMRLWATAGMAALPFVHMGSIPANPAWSNTVKLTCFGALGASVVFYGARFTYVAYDLVMLIVYWEIGQRFIRTSASEEQEILLEPIAAYLNVPSEIESPLPRSVAESVVAENKSQPKCTAAPDDLLMKYLDTLDDYMNARTRTGASLGTAFQQLARAKIVLGNAGTHLGRDLYDERMTAQVHVTPELCTVRKEHETSAQLPKPSDKDGLRRRKHGTDERKELDEKDQPIKEESNTSSAAGAAGYDPLLQFCGLPPPSLRNSQRHFSEALDHLTRPGGVLALQAKLVELEDAIRAARTVE